MTEQIQSLYGKGLFDSGLARNDSALSERKAVILSTAKNLMPIGQWEWATPAQSIPSGRRWC